VRRVSDRKNNLLNPYSYPVLVIPIRDMRDREYRRRSTSGLGGSGRRPDAKGRMAEEILDG
jgi:hypothetical protein